MSYRKKLIEVSLPLEAINVESAREKSIRHGHPSTLHLWWARRPLAACRAVLWSSLVDDPGEYMPDEESANNERERLFRILEELVKWENINNEDVLDKAKLEIARSVARDLGCDVPVGKEAIREFLATKAPPVLDPFAGGGSIPLEAQRLGLRAYASDLNPVAVLINKAMIEIPPKFAGLPPVHPPETGQRQESLLKKEWKGAAGLAEDVRYYGKWMRDEAEKRIGHLYPKVMITQEMLEEREDLRQQGLKPGDELTVIAWLWARTVKCPNPACGCQMPLVRSFLLSTKKGKQAWIKPIIEHINDMVQISYEIKVGIGTPHDGTVARNGSRCLACDTPIALDYIREEGQAGKILSELIAIVINGPSGQIFIPPNSNHSNIAKSALPNWEPETELPNKALGFRVQLYGLKSHKDLFTKRQLIALSTFSNLIDEVKEIIIRNILSVNYPNSEEYIKTLIVFLAFAVDRAASMNSSICWWNQEGFVTNTFARPTLSMTWDYAETNILSDTTGNWMGGIEWIARAIPSIDNAQIGKVSQVDASTIRTQFLALVSTDPPYYDNIGYGDLSDFFYIWLRKPIAKIYPELFATLLVPKTQELIASPYRNDDSMERAKAFFEEGIKKVFGNLNNIQDSQYPMTVYYAFKQAENYDEKGDNLVSSTGWETFLEGLVSSNFTITGTWPIRTERSTRPRNQSSNALASSIVLVARIRSDDAGIINRREFFSKLKSEIPSALRKLQQGNIAPVDLAQAAIGPGMAIFSRYSSVLEADGSPMRVRAALALINQALDEYLAEQEGEYDSDTRWALAWFEQYGHEQGAYGVAETLSKAKNTSVEGLTQAGFLEARSGKVRLLRR
ncbi:MAG: DUF1156 domain-containing protein, partial [Chloroflexota bacterium]